MDRCARTVPPIVEVTRQGRKNLYRLLPEPIGQQPSGFIPGDRERAAWHRYQELASQLERNWALQRKAGAAKESPQREFAEFVADPHPDPPTGAATGDTARVFVAASGQDTGAIMPRYSGSKGTGAAPSQGSGFVSPFDDLASATSPRAVNASS